MEKKTFANLIDGYSRKAKFYKEKKEECENEAKKLFVQFVNEHLPSGTLLECFGQRYVISYEKTVTICFTHDTKRSCELPYVYVYAYYATKKGLPNRRKGDTIINLAHCKIISTPEK